MPKITFKDQSITIEVPAGTSILQASQKAEAPVGSACGGVLACSTCHCYILSGGDSLSGQEEEEEDILDKAFDVRGNSRLGCQSKVSTDDVVVQISRESLDAYYNEHPDERPKPVG